MALQLIKFIAKKIQAIFNDELNCTPQVMYEVLTEACPQIFNNSGQLKQIHGNDKNTKKQHAEFIKVLDEQTKLHSQTIGVFETFNKNLCTEKKRKCRESSDSN
ncbi:hypothetical protein QTP88_028796 [Uroleucon formosanum]